MNEDETMIFFHFFCDYKNGTKKEDHKTFFVRDETTQQYMVWVWYYLKEQFKGVTLDRVRHVYSRVPAVVIQPFAFRDGGFFRG